MAASLHVALIGQKFMGRAHSNAWGQVGRFFDLPMRVVLDTVAARDEGELRDFATRWGWSRSTARWQDLAEDPAIGLVDVATPNDAHREQALAMLAAGKHVACEKPLAGTLDDARAMHAAAREARGRTFVWFNYRRCPAVALAYRLVRAGRLGRIRHVRATYLQSWGGPETPMSWRFEGARAGSGAHGDLNAHVVDLARFLVGEEIVEVHGAVARTFVEERGVAGTQERVGVDVDDAVLFLASFAGGAVASFEASRVATGRGNAQAIELNGEKGALRFEFEDMNVLEYFDAESEGLTAGWRRIEVTSGAAGHPYVAGWWPEGHGLGYEHGFVNMGADIVRVLAGMEPEVPVPDFADAWETQRVLAAALVSAGERRSVRVSEVR